MFQIHKSEVAKLSAFDRELEMRARIAARWKRSDLLEQINQQRRKVRRAILLRREFEDNGEPSFVTIADLLARYS